MQWLRPAPVNQEHPTDTDTLFCITIDHVFSMGTDLLLYIDTGIGCNQGLSYPHMAIHASQMQSCDSSL